MRNPGLHWLLAPVLLASIAPAVRAQVAFGTGFETARYILGQSIDGIDGWVGAASPLACTVVGDSGLASLGHRALQCWGGDPNLHSYQYPGYSLLDGAWYRDAPDLPFRHDALVRVQCDVRLDGPFTPFDLLSANLIARNGSWNSAQLWLSSDGNVYCNSWGTDPVTLEPFEHTYKFGTPVPHGQYVRLAITYDYTLHLAAFEVDGVTVGVLPFGGPGEGGFNGVFLELAAYDDPLYVDPSLYTGYWDNVGYVAIPRR